MKRIDVTISDPQCKLLEEEVKEKGISKSEIIRNSLELYFEVKREKWIKRMKQYDEANVPMVGR